MKKALVVGRTLIDDKSGGARGTLSDILAIKEIYGKNIKVVLPLEACQRLEKEFQVETIPVPKRNSIQKLLGAITLTSMDRLRPFIDNNMEEIFSDVDIVFFTGSVLGRYAEDIRDKFDIPTVVFHRNHEKTYYRDTDAKFPINHIKMIVSDRQQKSSWIHSDISLVRTRLDLEKIKSSYGESNRFAALYGYHEAIDATKIPCETGEAHSPVKIAITANLSVYKAYVGIVWFIESVVDKIIEENIPYELIIAGRDPTEAILRYHDSRNITVIANPEDINKVIQNCDIYVNPCSQGSGIKVRNSDGPRNGLPIICHRDNAHGFEHLPEQLLSQFTTASEFVDQLKLKIKWLETTEQSKAEIYQQYCEYFSIESGANYLRKVISEAGFGKCLPTIESHP